MSLSRQFLNLIVADHGFPGVRSLCCIDLTLQQFFHPTTPPQPPNGTGSEPQGSPDATSQSPAIDAVSHQKNKQAAGLTMDDFQLPHPCFTFRAPAPALNDERWKIDCFPLADCKVICADQLGHAFCFDANTRQAGTMPSLHRPKSMPLSLFVPNAGADTDFTYGRNPLGSSLFVMEKIPKPEVGCSTPHSDQFEVFVYRKPKSAAYIKVWHCQLLPPPPYVRQPKYWHGRNRPEIGSYAVVGGGPQICISVEGVGTYCLDTASHTWSEVGRWTLPFHGRVEYAPELKLWFGLSADARHLVAADLSAMDSQSQLVGAWKELCLPEQWKEFEDPQFVNLGSGRFCIARFFPTTTADDLGDGSSGEDVAVLTGVEVVPRVHDASGGNEEIMELQMIPHISKRLNCTSIEALF